MSKLTEEKRQMEPNRAEVENHGNDYTIPKLTKEKREREPNWTEPEKQLLMSLIRVHRHILDNKSNDRETIKLKSLAWDEIASTMLSAGYNRSKERLKQQYGRIRAAEAKKLNDAHRNSDQKEGFKINLNTILGEKGSKAINFMKINEAPKLLEDNINIKGDKYFTNDGLNIKDPNCNENYVSTPTNHPYIKQKTKGNILKTIDVISKIDTITDSTSAGSPPITKFKTVSPNCTDKLQLDIGMDVTNNRPAIKNNSQLQLYRIAAERERIRALKLHRQHLRVMEREHLRMLRIQQKRDYTLYRKNVQIQDLKVQLLQGLIKRSKCETKNGLR